MEGRKALIHPSHDGSVSSLPQSFPSHWAGLDGSSMWNGHWDFNPLQSSDFSNLDLALENFVRQHAMAESSGSSSVRTVAEDQGMPFEPLNDAWMAGSHQTAAMRPDMPDMQRHSEQFPQRASQGNLDIELSIDPMLSEYAPAAPEPPSTDLTQGFDNMQADFEVDMQFHSSEQNPSSFDAPEQSLQTAANLRDDVQDHTPAALQRDADIGLNRLGALADAASALSPSPCPARSDGPIDVTSVPSRKRRRTAADSAMMANINVIDIGWQKASPKLSSSLPVAGE